MNRLSQSEVETFSRQLLLSNWSEAKQLRLKSLRIGICSTLEATSTYLQAAGAKTIRHISEESTEVQDLEFLILRAADIATPQSPPYPQTVEKLLEKIPSIAVSNQGTSYRSKKDQGDIRDEIELCTLGDGVNASSNLSQQAQAASKLIALLATNAL